MDGVVSPDAGRPASLGWLKALVLLLAAMVTTHGVNYAVLGFPGESGRVWSDAAESFGLIPLSTRPGYLEVRRVAPDRQLAAAGVREGDSIRFEHPWDAFRTNLPAGTRFNLTILRDGQTIPTAFVTGPSRPRGWRAERLLSSFTCLFMALAGIVIALRARAGAGVLLGASLIAMAHMGSYPFDWENDVVRYFHLPTLWGAIMALAPVGLFAFALIQRSRATGRAISRTWKAVFWVYVAVAAADFLNYSYASIALARPPLPMSFVATILMAWSGHVLALGVLVRGAVETAGEDRTRFGFLAAALGLYFGGTAFTGMIINLTGNDFSLANPVALAGQVLACLGVVVFLYAALRHRVVDLGFAVNRTLVFGALSTALLFAFFFLEWGAEQVIPADMREASLLASAGIAFVLFLVFHKVRDWVEKGVETLFFRQWRNKEAELRRFMRQAAFVTRAEMLRASAVAAFSRFAEGAGVALYRREGEAYVRAEGEVAGLDAQLDPDTPALVRLRAQLEPLEDDLPAGAALMLPVIQRKEVTGFFVFGPKPAGELYRPDEREALAEAAARVGLDLHALRVEALEVESREQRRRADTLERQMQRALKAGARA